MLSIEEIENNRNNKKNDENNNIIFFKCVFFSLLFYILKSKGFEKILDSLKKKIIFLKIISNNLIQIMLFGFIYFIIEYYIK